MCQLLLAIRSDVPIIAWTVILNTPIAGFYQVEVTDDENADNYSETNRPCVSRRGLYGFLSRYLDTLDDHFIRS